MNYDNVKAYIRMTEEEVDELLRHSRGTVVEIGTLYGASAVLMSNISDKVYTIDNGKNGITEANAKEFLGGVENIEIIRGDSSKIEWNDAIDMLFVDGDHSYEGVKADIKNWLRFVGEDTIICFHDYGSKDGVTKALNEYIENQILYPIKQVGSLLVTKKL